MKSYLALRLYTAYPLLTSVTLYSNYMHAKYPALRVVSDADKAAYNQNIWL
jgi:hypothetical protein